MQANVVPSITYHIKRYGYLPNKISCELLNKKLKIKHLSPISLSTFKKIRTRNYPNLHKKFYMFRARGIGKFMRVVRARMAQAGWKSTTKRNYYGGQLTFRRYIKDGQRTRRLRATFRIDRKTQGEWPFRIFITERIKGKEVLLGWQRHRYWIKLMTYADNEELWQVNRFLTRYWQKYCHYREIPKIYGCLNERVVKANYMMGIYENKYF